MCMLNRFDIWLEVHVLSGRVVLCLPFSGTFYFCFLQCSLRAVFPVSCKLFIYSYALVLFFSHKKCTFEYFLMEIIIRKEFDVKFVLLYCYEIDLDN